jgi:hypothetical protein
MNVPTSPIIRMEILIVRFMGSSPLIRVGLSLRNAFLRSGIIGHVSTSLCNNFHLASIAPLCGPWIQDLKLQ